jgi:hypothetical protein
MARNRVLGILNRGEICDFPAVLLATIRWCLDCGRVVTAGVNPA